MADILSPHTNLVRIPSAEEKVLRDEAAFSFDTPESEDGLYICMRHFVGIGRKHVDLYFQKTSSAIFLHIKRIRHEVVPDPDKAFQRMVMRPWHEVHGGKPFDVKEVFAIVVLPEWAVYPLTSPDLSSKVTDSAMAVICRLHEQLQYNVDYLDVVWTAEPPKVSRFADNLDQLKTGKKIPPSGWSCEQCQAKKNLWLNLTDGAILCGRNVGDNRGNDHAIEHYELTKFPLVVKLGTITPDGAVLFSYPEDDLVSDPHLPQHLAHFGIDLMKMEKTDRTMMEMELDLNQRVWEWNTLQESGSKLQPIYGAGYTGIYNLGNSCYMNAIMQVVFTLPSFVDRYCTLADQIFMESNCDDPASDFRVQMAKLGVGLLSGDYSKPPTATTQRVNGVHPRQFRNIIGSGHPEFSTNHQQDAVDFLRHLITKVERTCRGEVCPTDCIKIRLEERYECGESQKVRYLLRDEYILSLPVPLDKAVNLCEVAAFKAKKATLELENKCMNSLEVVIPRLRLTSCLDSFTACEKVEGFFSTAVKHHVTAKKSLRMSTFPEVLFIQIQRFTVGTDWVERKLDVSIDVPDELDISSLRATGKQPTEEELPEDDAPDVERMQVEKCHSEEFEFTADDGYVDAIVKLGFTRTQALVALKATDNSLQRATDWIFSHVMELDDMEEVDRPAVGPTYQPQATASDNHGRYQLSAFLSHMGPSSTSGHYVSHIVKEGRWVLFNDDKVTLSENPPKDLAYIYMYRKI